MWSGSASSSITSLVSPHKSQCQRRAFTRPKIICNRSANTNLSTYWDTNNVWVKLKDGSVVRTSYDTNLHPWMNQNAMAGPWRFGLDASAFKSIRGTEAVGLRLNVDFFSVLNNPGLNLPGGNGIL